jgi:CRP-like cAMP-binding protein
VRHSPRRVPCASRLFPGISTPPTDISGSRCASTRARAWLGEMQAIRLGRRGTNGVKRRSIDREDCNWHLLSSETLEPLHAHKGCSYRQFHAEGGSSSMPNSCDPNQNHLLAALSAAERDRIFPYLQLVSMALGEVLSDPGNIQRYVYFPTDCIISFSYLMRDGASTEIALAGNEGLVGLALLTGAQKSPSRAVVQSAGNAYRLDGERLRVEFHRGGGLQAMLLRYTHAVMTQIAHTAACNRHHTVDQQLCRSLLAYLDRVSSNQLSLTQEAISNMLGVRREGVSLAATKLQSLGAIRYSRGQITVVDRSKLERESCECYTAIKKETDRLVFQ